MKNLWEQPSKLVSISVSHDSEFYTFIKSLVQSESTAHQFPQWTDENNAFSFSAMSCLPLAIFYDTFVEQLRLLTYKWSLGIKNSN